VTQSGIVWIGTLVVGSLAWTVVVAGPPVVESLVARWDGVRVHVSYRVSGGLTDEAIERIHSGIPVLIRHRIELRARRGFLRIARELGRTVIATHVEYDSLTQQYRLLREARVHRPSGAGRHEPVVEETVTDSLEDMHAWMTRITDVAVEPIAARPWAAARVRVDVTLDRRWVWFVFPSTVEVSDTVEVEMAD